MVCEVGNCEFSAISPNALPVWILIMCVVVIIICITIGLIFLVKKYKKGGGCVILETEESIKKEIKQCIIRGRFLDCWEKVFLAIIIGLAVIFILLLLISIPISIE